MLTSAGLGGVGWMRARALSGRCHDLEQLRQALAVMQAAISHTRLPAAQAFERAGRAGRGVLAQACRLASRALREGPGLAAGDAWMEAMRALLDRCFLAPGDMAVLEEFCLHFGRVDAATQEALFHDAIARVDLALEQARQDRDRLERLYRFSGLAVGLAVGIMLL
ncbi:MAG: stage III sporulation protein AB [Bacillota bacterium]